LVAGVEQALGPVDVLVANAGVSRRLEFDDIDLETWDETLAVNLRAPFLLARWTIPGMRARRWGRVLFMSSVAAFTGGLVGAHYAASKAGLHGLTHYLARRLAPFGVTVNAIAPALIAETGMLPGDPGDLHRLVPVGRLGRPEEVADLTLAVLTRDTWRGLEAFTDREHQLPVDNVRLGAAAAGRAEARVGDYTNVTSIGLRLIAIVAAHELGLATEREAVGRLRALLDTLGRLETHDGFFF